MRKMIKGLARKLATLGTIGAGTLAIGNMNGCGPLMQGYGIQTGNAGLAALGAGVTQLQAAQLRANGERDAARIYSGNNRLNQAPAGTSFDQNKAYLFLSDSPWTDLNLNGWYDSNEFGNIRNEFFIGRDDSFYIHVFLPKGRKANENLRIQVFNTETNQWRTAQEHNIPGKDFWYLCVDARIQNSREERASIRAVYGEEKDLHYQFSPAFVIGPLNMVVR